MCANFGMEVNILRKAVKENMGIPFENLVLAVLVIKVLEKPS